MILDTPVDMPVPPNCTGGDGAYRIDQPDDVAWLAQVLAGSDPDSETDPDRPHAACIARTRYRSGR